MKVMIVDDGRLAALSLENTVREALCDRCEIKVYNNGMDVSGDNFAPDIAMLDIEMPGISGLELAERLKRKYPDIIIIYVTAYSDYAMNAWNLGVDGYLLKPVSVEDVRNVLYDVFAKRKIVPDEPRRLTVRCFGKFEVFFDGEIVSFKRSRAKEMLAYLVCARGAGVTSGELCGVLWDDSTQLQRQKTYVRQYASSMRESFANFGLHEVLIHNRDSYAVNTELIDCDYYKYLGGEIGREAYTGEFISQYEWAEWMNPLVSLN